MQLTAVSSAGKLCTVGHESCVRELRGLSSRSCIAAFEVCMTAAYLRLPGAHAHRQPAACWQMCDRARHRRPQRRSWTRVLLSADLASLRQIFGSVYWLDVTTHVHTHMCDY